MRICVLVRKSCEPKSRVSKIAEFLHASGHDVLIIAQAHGNLPAFCVVNGVTYRRLQGQSRSEVAWHKSRFEKTRHRHVSGATARMNALQEYASLLRTLYEVSSVHERVNEGGTPRIPIASRLRTWIARIFSLIDERLRRAYLTVLKRFSAQRHELARKAQEHRRKRWNLRWRQRDVRLSRRHQPKHKLDALHEKQTAKYQELLDSQGEEMRQLRERLGLADKSPSTREIEPGARCYDSVDEAIADLEADAAQLADDMRATVHAFEPNVLHCHDFETLQAGARLAEEVDVPFIYDVQSAVDDRPDKTDPHFREAIARTERRIGQRAAAVFAASEALGMELRTERGIRDPIMIYDASQTLQTERIADVYDTLSRSGAPTKDSESKCAGLSA